MSILFGYALTGLLAGFLAGLLGIGGGLVIVPLLTLMFALQGFDAALVMPFALGTSMAAIVFTSASSMYAHHVRRAVDWGIVRNMVPGIVLGTMLGAILLPQVPQSLLRGIFVLNVALAAVQLLGKIEPRPATQNPRGPGLVAVGGAVGGVSMLAGIGGATLTVPFMLWSNVPARVAIGTAAALGLPIALFGTIGYVAIGMSIHGRPPYAVGFVHLPALAAIVGASMISAPLGAAASHNLPVPVLKRCFVCMLLVATVKMMLG